MTPTTLSTLIFAAFVVGGVQGTLSNHYTELLIEYSTKVHGVVTKVCFAQFNVMEAKFSYTDDTKMAADICEDVNNTQALNKCMKSDLNYIKDKICDMITDSNKNMADKVIKYGNQVTKLSADCQKQIKKTSPNLSTWYGIEQYCNKIEKTDKDAFEKACPGSDYGDLKDVVCGGAMGLLSGFFTLGLCFLASLFNKL